MTAAQLHTSSRTSESDSVRRIRPANRSATVVGMLLGLGATFVFYLVAPRAAQPFAGWPEFVQRYFCGHPIEYITSAMFFVGMGILWVKLRQLPAERRALRSLQEFRGSTGWSADGVQPSDVAGSLNTWQKQARSDGLSKTILSQRLENVLHYFSNRRDGLEEHLRYLADLASDRQLQSYSLIRTVTWAVPIMGFLGTVVGITMAIANVTPEQLDSSLPEVTAGLAIAFDTTAQALGMSMILVFGTFLLERCEQSILSDIEQFGIDHLAPSLFVKEESTEPPLTGVAALTDWTSVMLAEQTESWSRHLSSLQTGWAEALTTQTGSMADALSRETRSMLEMHRNSLSGARDLYAATLQQSTHHFTHQIQETLQAFVERVDSWQNALQTSSMSSASQAEELHCLGRTMLQLTESEERLAHLQNQLNQNLQTLEVVATLEQTLNSLNAAVNVLTAKTALRIAA